MEFSRQEYWNGLPFPFPGDLTDPGIEPRSPVLQADSLLSEPPPLCYSCLFLLFIFNWRVKQLLYPDKLLCNVLLVSAVQHESSISVCVCVCIYIYIYICSCLLNCKLSNLAPGLAPRAPPLIAP